MSDVKPNDESERQPTDQVSQITMLGTLEVKTVNGRHIVFQGAALTLYATDIDRFIQAAEEKPLPKLPERPLRQIAKPKPAAKVGPNGIAEDTPMGKLPDKMKVLMARVGKAGYDLSKTEVEEEVTHIVSQSKSRLYDLTYREAKGLIGYLDTLERAEGGERIRVRAQAAMLRYLASGESWEDSFNNTQWADIETDKRAEKTAGKITETRAASEAALNLAKQLGG